MTDPIQVEERYQELHAELEAAASFRYAYAIATQFIRELDGEYRRYATYIIQLTELLARYENPLTWSGLNPEDLESQIDLFEQVIMKVGGEETGNLLSITDHLRGVSLLLFGCLGDQCGASRHFLSLTGEPFQTRKNQGPLLGQIGKNIRESTRFTRETGWILDQIQKLNEKPENSLLIPVAEIYEGSVPKRFGRLRRLYVDFFGKSDKNDELAREYRFIGAEVPVEDSDHDALNAARQLFNLRYSGGNLHSYKGLARYEISGALHEGRSSDLALAALWYTRLEEATKQRIRYELNPSAAVTGRLDCDGRVEAVEEETIRLKAEAAFFSRAEVLVVPTAQKNIFEKCLEDLRERYPNRKLLLLDAENLEELFYDRRVAPLKIESRIGYALRRAKEIRYRAVGVPLVLLLTGIILWQVFGPIDKNPAAYRYDGNFLFIENRFGQDIISFEVSPQTARVFSFPAFEAYRPGIQLVDVNGDGINEVIYGERTRIRQNDSEISKVTAYSVSGDSLMWERELRLNYTFPRQSSLPNKEMLLREIGVVETAEGPKVLINSNSYYYFQTVVFLLNPQTGEVDGEYVHIGHTRDMVTWDVTDDGIDEVFLLGINNAYWMASLAVLDVNRMTGHSPLTRDYKPEGLKPAEELYYILFPKTVVGTYANSVMKYNEGTTIQFDTINNTIQAQIEEGRYPFRDDYGRLFIFVSLNREMQPVGFGTSDQYDIVARQLYEEGEISFEPDYDYFQAYMDSLLYWTGEEFVPTQEYFKNGS